ncbi:hypothetical protein [uncultured Campylobacter sp.]|nr:hypothetical protein [uncultured Campylobacter sp.]
MPSKTPNSGSNLRWTFKPHAQLVKFGIELCGDRLKFTTQIWHPNPHRQI